MITMIGLRNVFVCSMTTEQQRFYGGQRDKKMEMQMASSLKSTTLLETLHIQVLR